MIKVNDFIREVEKIAASRPEYKMGGTGKGGVLRRKNGCAPLVRMRGGGWRCVS